jgi:sugar-specific transcriptional regulator TrmB
MLEDGGLLAAGEEEVYRLLVRLSRARPTEIAGLASMPIAEATSVLTALRGKGLATEVPGAAGREPLFRPLPPDVALGDALLRRQSALDSARQAVAALSEEYRTQTRRHNADHLVEVIVGRVALRERLRDMQNAAQEEILWFCKANPLAMAGTENTEESAALARGVSYRAVYERALLEAPGELASIAESVSAGEEARTLPMLPVRLAIIDRSAAICPLVPDDDRGVIEPTAALIRRSELLDALLSLFESHWERASPIRPGTLELDPAEAPPAGARVPIPSGTSSSAAPGDGADRLLLSLLVAGLPDKSIANQLRISRRTVQRRVDRLMLLAGVDTRIGLAFQAARRNWL